MSKGLAVQSCTLTCPLAVGARQCLVKQWPPVGGVANVKCFWLLWKTSAAHLALSAQCCIDFCCIFYFDAASTSQGCVPMYVNATAGTTVYGAFDPIDEIADICEKHNMWLHVDVSERSSCPTRARPLPGRLNVAVCAQGAWGGGLLMSRRHRHKLSGIER